MATAVVASYHNIQYLTQTVWTLRLGWLIGLKGAEQSSILRPGTQGIFQHQYSQPESDLLGFDVRGAFLDFGFPLQVRHG